MTPGERHDDCIEPIDFKHRSADIQGAIRNIQLWLSSFDLPPLTSYCTNQSDTEYSKSVLLEIIDNYPEQLINYLHDQPSRTLAGALAYLIINAIGIPLNNKNAYRALTNLLCVSNDSFVIDFVLICLGNRTTVCSSTNFTKRITKCIFFLQSESPKYKEQESFVDNLILSFKTLDEIDSSKFRSLLEEIMYKIETISTNFKLNRCLLSGFEHTLETKAIGDTFILGYNTRDDYYDIHGDDQTVPITPTNASYNYLCKYRSHYFSQKKHIEELMDHVESCIKIQESCMDGCSSLISLGLAQIKSACIPIFEQIELAEKYLWTFERGFVSFHLCHLMSTNYITQKIDMMIESTKQRHIYFDEIIELGDLINTKTELLLALKMTFKLSNKFSNDTLGKAWQDRISEEKMDCKDLIMNYNHLMKIWTELAPIIESNKNIHQILNQLKLPVGHNNDNDDDTNTALEIMYDEVYYVNSKRFRIFLGRNQLQLQDPLYKSWEIMPIEIKSSKENSCIPETELHLMISKLITLMIENTSKNLFELRDKINVEAIIKK